jgi:hypothetical protein
MAISTTDARAKAVLAQLIDKVSAAYPLASLYTDMGAAMQKGESIDIPTRSAVTIQQVSAGAAASSMTVQTNTPTANNLKVDQHYGAIVEIPPFQQIFDLEGTWSAQLASQVQTELSNYVDATHWAETIFTGAYSTDAKYYVNPAGDALAPADLENAWATMLDQKGVTLDGLAWVMHPFGMGSVRANSAWIPSESSASGQIGTPLRMQGTLHGIPVFISQNVPRTKDVTSTAWAINTNVLTVTVAAGHGLVPGLPCTFNTVTAGGDMATATAIKSVTATTVVFDWSASNANATEAGTITCAKAFNALVYRPWIFSRRAVLPDVRIVPVSGGASGNSRITDELQAHTIWGSKSLAGSAIVIPSPGNSVT